MGRPEYRYSTLSSKLSIHQCRSSGFWRSKFGSPIPPFVFSLIFFPHEKFFWVSKYPLLEAKPFWWFSTHQAPKPLTIGLAWNCWSHPLQTPEAWCEPVFDQRFSFKSNPSTSGTGQIPVRIWVIIARVIEWMFRIMQCDKSNTKPSAIRPEMGGIYFWSIQNWWFFRIGFRLQLGFSKLASLMAASRLSSSSACFKHVLSSSRHLESDVAISCWPSGCMYHELNTVMLHLYHVLYIRISYTVSS